VTFISVVRYPSPTGPLAAYLCKLPSSNPKRPAIIWLTGGFSNSIGGIAWTPGPQDNDQSGSTFWEAGIITFYPSLRGGNDHPGHFENFYGEVDDVLAAADYLRTLPEVDAERIYLGGHSTGGTLALLAAELGSRFRAVFAFGPTDNVLGYGDDVLVFDTTNRKEAELRAPILWMNGITAPTFVFEGGGGRSNIASLQEMARSPHPSVISFHPVPDSDHFALLRPVSALIAAKILKDTGPAPSIVFTSEELKAAMK
jgi:dipeptidyl aminopeptidase/acylaminoacyl peptidase